MLWTALTNATPYAGSDVQIGMSHLSDPVPQLAESSPVARAVNDVLQRSMTKDPAQRYPSAAAMRAALQELGRLAQTTPHPPLAPSRGTAPGPPPPRRRRTGLVVASAVAGVVLVVGTVATVVALGADDEPDRPSTTSTTSTQPLASGSTSEPTLVSPIPPTLSPPPTTTPPPEPDPGLTPSYPDVPAASGINLELGRASMRAPAGWGRITQTDLPNGVGSRDYSDYEGYYSSVFLERSEPAFPLTSVTLLEAVASGAVDLLADQNPEIDLISNETLPPGWLDGDQAARVRGVYQNTDTDLFFAEESWFVQKGQFLHRITFQHSRADSLDERRDDIDPMVVSFRWR